MFNNRLDNYVLKLWVTHCFSTDRARNIVQTLGKGLQRGATLPSSPLGGLLPPTTLAEVSCVTRVPAEGCVGGGGTACTPPASTALQEGSVPPKTPQGPAPQWLGLAGVSHGPVGKTLKARLLQVAPSPDIPIPGTLGCQNWGWWWGFHPPFPPAFGWAAGLGAVFCRQEASGRARNSADWLLCYYPETGAGAERASSWWGAPALVFTPMGERTPAPNSPPCHHHPRPRGGWPPAAVVPRRGLLFCAGEQRGRSRASCLQPPLGWEFILCWFIFLLLWIDAPGWVVVPELYF